MPTLEPLPATRSRLPLALGAAFLLLWCVLAWRPSFRQDWLLENVLVFATAPWLVDCYRRRPFSAIAYAGFWLFFSLHIIGAHYTYALVPYDDWWRAIFGVGLNQSLGLQRNHYDRLVHFLYGFLLAAPAVEVVARNTRCRGFGLWSATVLFMTSHSAIYEIIEWGAAMLFGGSLGQASLGTQGDEWDSQKDMALLSVGAVLGVTAYFWLARTATRRGIRAEST
jgi:putative membrane protein